MCDILTGDLPRNIGCLDERRFLLVIPAALTVRQRTALARNIFEQAGMEQTDDDVTCLCGLEAEFPREASGPFARLPAGWRCTLSWAAAAAVLTAGNAWLLAMAHVR